MLLLMKCYIIIKFFKELLFCLKLIIYLQYENETNYIKYDYPKTYEYSTEHQEIFNGRKSSIYNNKPPFSIFGVGDYSFKPYKVAISGLYKTFHFKRLF